MCNNTFTFFIYKINIDRGNMNHPITYLGQTLHIDQRLKIHLNRDPDSAKLLLNLYHGDPDNVRITEIQNLYRINIHLHDLPNTFDAENFKNSIRVNFENLIYDCLKTNIYDFGAYNVPSEIGKNNLTNGFSKINNRINKLVNKIINAAVHLDPEINPEKLHQRIHCTKQLDEIINESQKLDNNKRKTYISNQLKQFKSNNLFNDITNQLSDIDDIDHEQICRNLLSEICNTFNVENIIDLDYQYINHFVTIKDNFIHDLQQNGIDHFVNWNKN